MLSPRAYFIGKPFEFELTYVDLHPLSLDYIYIMYHDKIKDTIYKMDTDQLGVQAMLEAVDGYNLIELSRCMQEKIFVHKDFQDCPLLENKITKLGVIVDNVILSKLPTMAEYEDIVIYDPFSTKNKRHKKGFFGKMFGWLFDHEIHDLNLDKS